MTAYRKAQFLDTGVSLEPSSKWIHFRCVYQLGKDLWCHSILNQRDAACRKYNLVISHSNTRWFHPGFNCNFRVTPYNSNQYGKPMERTTRFSHVRESPINHNKNRIAECWNTRVIYGEPASRDQSKSWKTCLFWRKRYNIKSEVCI
jgi:hypothetical protein